MGTKPAPRPQASPGLQKIAKLLNQYGCGSVRFSGADEALYERHLLFDKVVDVAAATPRDRFEAFAHSVRDVLSQRWILTEKAYERQNPKRLYYLSMEFLIGRSLANNVTNLLLTDIEQQSRPRDKNLNWIEILEQEPDAGLGNGGLGRLAACFMESAATMQLPAMGYGLRYEYGIFKQSIRDGWQQEKPDNWLRSPDPWEVARPERKSGNRAELLVRAQGGQPSRNTRKAINSDRHSVRPPRRRLRRVHDQHPPALGCRRARLLRFRRIQQRRLCRGAGPDAIR